MVTKTNLFKMSKSKLEQSQIEQLLSQKKHGIHPICHEHSQHMRKENDRIWKI